MNFLSKFSVTRNIFSSIRRCDKINNNKNERNMKVEAISINQVFLNNRVLKIPFFQRGYVWTEENWQRFFDDIANGASLLESENPETHFLGSIILKDAGYKSGFHQFDVIDGQQRLTTIVMFMNVTISSATASCR